MSGWGDEPSSKSDENVPLATTPMIVANPQEKGWIKKEVLDYASLVDDKAVGSQYWGHARAKYDYVPEEDEFIGPRIEELEKQLFSFEHKVQVGEHMHRVQEVEVVCEGPEPIKPIQKVKTCIAASVHTIYVSDSFV